MQNAGALLDKLADKFPFMPVKYVALEHLPLHAQFDVLTAASVCDV
jgi:hypothetical protein